MADSPDASLPSSAAEYRTLAQQLRDGADGIDAVVNKAEASLAAVGETLPSELRTGAEGFASWLREAAGVMDEDAALLERNE